jgi:hypothetical protein
VQPVVVYGTTVNIHFPPISDVRKVRFRPRRAVAPLSAKARADLGYQPGLRAEAFLQ